MLIELGELQAAYRGLQRGDRRRELHRYLIDGSEPNAAAFRLVSRHLYACGLVDNLGLTDIWVGTASVAERARLFSAIATGLMNS